MTEDNNNNIKSNLRGVQDCPPVSIMNTITDSAGNSFSFCTQQVNALPGEIYRAKITVGNK